MPFTGSNRSHSVASITHNDSIVNTVVESLQKTPLDNMQKFRCNFSAGFDTIARPIISGMEMYALIKKIFLTLLLM
jgi:hypothetical protein